MPYLITGFLLLANVLFWGAGLARLLTPRRYRRFALVFAPLAGLSLQSLVVWTGAWANLSGTDSYAGWTMALPVVLLGASWFRDRRSGSAPGWGRLGSLWLLLVVQLAVLLTPFALSGHGLTTSSMGSLDAADYAAGARVLQEFAHHERTGFLGQAEVVSLGAVDNFYDFWLRTNHFTPSALIAFNGSLFGLVPHQLTSVFTVVMLTCAVPIVFWIARSGFRYRPGLSLAIAALYAVNPINWYAVYNVAPAQIIAANAIALLTWCGLVSWRNIHGRAGRLRVWFGLLLVAYTLIFGAYNFIIVVCLAPAIAYAGAETLAKRQFAAFGRWLWVMGVPLVVAGAIYATRSLGVVERFVLLQAGFGWDVPRFGPEGWFGMLDGSWLRPLADPARPLLLALALVLLVLPFVRAVRTRRRLLLVAACVFAPVAVGYAILQMRYMLTGKNASYDAYKLLSVFYPGVLCALCYGVHVLASAGRRWKAAGAGALMLVFAANLWGEWRVLYRMTSPRFVVEERHRMLSALEADAGVASINIRIADGWSKLWANALLLKKPQYFDVYTYEGRRAIGLRGDWDLNGPFFVLRTTDAADWRQPSDRFSLLKRSSMDYLEPTLGPGWSEVTGGLDGGPWWTRWSLGESASLSLLNPHAYSLRVAVSAEVRALSSRSCEIVVRGERLARLQLTAGATPWRTEGLVVPPGETLIEFRTPEPPTDVGGRVRHGITIGLDGCTIEIERAPVSGAAQ